MEITPHGRHGLMLIHEAGKAGHVFHSPYVRRNYEQLITQGMIRTVPFGGKLIQTPHYSYYRGRKWRVFLTKKGEEYLLDMWNVPDRRPHYMKVRQLLGAKLNEGLQALVLCGYAARCLDECHIERPVFTAMPLWHSLNKLIISLNGPGAEVPRPPHRLKRR